MTHYHYVSDFSLEFGPVMPGYRSAIANHRLASALRQTAVTNVFQGSRGASTLNHTPPFLRNPYPTTHPPFSCESAVMQPRGADTGQWSGVNIPSSSQSLQQPAIWELLFAAGELLICFSTPQPLLRAGTQDKFL